MNHLFLQLKVALLALLHTTSTPLSEGRYPELARVLDQLRMGGLFRNPVDQLIDDFHGIIAALERRFDYYDESEMRVNTALDEYLNSEVMRLLWAEKPVLPEPRSIALTICALGNRGGDHDHGNGIGEIYDFAKTQLERISGYAVRPSTIHFLSLEREIDQLEFAERVLGIVDVFVTSRAGMVAGLEEFPPVDVSELAPIPEPDFTEVVCVGTTECPCGCVLEHGELLLEGMEDLLSDTDSYARNYLLGVASSQNVRLSAVAGNEGAILDGLKSMGETAYNTIMESLKAIMNVIDPKDSEESAKTIRETAENNKKALQAMPDKGTARINDAAKTGIQKLAVNTYPNGEMTTCISSISTADKAGGVIDKLLGLLQKEVSSGGALRDKEKETKTALDELKKASSDAASADEKNKDVVAAAKQKVNEKIAKARESLKGAKGEVKGHNKRIAGIRKAVSGISPKIFISEQKKDEEKTE